MFDFTFVLFRMKGRLTQGIHHLRNLKKLRLLVISCVEIYYQVEVLKLGCSMYLLLTRRRSWLKFWNWNYLNFSIRSLILRIFVNYNVNIDPDIVKLIIVADTNIC